MTAGAVILWRHGRTAYNAEGRMQGSLDIDLDDVGRWQVAEGAQHLAQRHRPAVVVTSPLRRAVRTATALADVVDVGVVTDPRLRERSFGQWEGCTAQEIRERWPEQAAAWRARDDSQMPGAETRAEVAARMADAIVEHAAALGPDDVLLMVSHGAAITLGIGALLGVDASWAGLSGLHNAHWSLLRPSGRRPGTWYLEAHNQGPAVVVEQWNAGLPSDEVPSSTSDALQA